MKVDAGLLTTGLADVREAVRAVEADGYDAAWTSEVKHDPFVALTVAATATERVELGTAVAIAFARNPMSTAVQANDLQLLSHGRLLLGLGSQIRAHITRRFGMPWSHPAPRMREYVLALRAIWDCWQTDGPLRFDGEFYAHTLMTPFFNPGPNPHGTPRVLLAGVGAVMTQVAGEVADGFLVHGFTTERYLREVTMPALRRGRELANKTLSGFEVAGSPLVATGRTGEELQLAADGVRGQIAFYGSTPAYRPVLELHGWGDLADRLHTMSLDGRWSEMAAAVDDEVLEAFAVVGEPAQVGAELLRRYGDLMTRMTFYTPYGIDSGVTAQVAEAIRAG